MSYDWPPGMRVKPIVEWPGQMSPSRSRANFSASFSSTVSLLWRELYQLGGRNVILQVGIPEQQFRIDGFPRADARADHPGVILTLDSKHGALSYPCDTFDRWQDNLRAIALALEALRKVDRYGVTKRGEQYTGFKAIGAVAMPPKMDEQEARRTLATFGGGDFRKAQRATHPDRGGDASHFDRVMQAGRALGLLT